MKTSFAGVSYAGLAIAAGIARRPFGWRPSRQPARVRRQRRERELQGPPRGDGKADLQGIWQAWNTAGYGLEAHNAATGIHAGKSFVVEPADGMIPYKPGARAEAAGQFQQARAAGYLSITAT